MLNLDQITNIARGDHGIISKFLTVFIENTQKDIRDLGSAVSQDDFKRIHYYVHKLKSSSQSMGFVNGFKRLQSIEEKLHLNHSIAPLRPELEAVSRECELAVKEARLLLEKYVK